MVEEAGPSYSRKQSFFGDQTALSDARTVQDECAGRLGTMFPPKQTLSSAGDLLHMEVTHAPLSGYDRNNAEALRNRCSCIHLAVHVEIVSEVAFKRVCVTFACPSQHIILEANDVASLCYGLASNENCSTQLSSYFRSLRSRSTMKSSCWVCWLCAALRQ